MFKAGLNLKNNCPYVYPSMMCSMMTSNEANYISEFNDQLMNPIDRLYTPFGSDKTENNNSLFRNDRYYCAFPDNIESNKEIQNINDIFEECVHHSHTLNTNNDPLNYFINTDSPDYVEHRTDEYEQIYKAINILTDKIDSLQSSFIKYKDNVEKESWQLTDI